MKNDSARRMACEICLLLLVICSSVPALAADEEDRGLGRRRTFFSLSFGSSAGGDQGDALDSIFSSQGFDVTSETGLSSHFSWDVSFSYSFHGPWTATALFSKTKLGETTIRKEPIIFPLRPSVETIAGIFSYISDERTLHFMQLQAGVGVGLFTSSLDQPSLTRYSQIKSDTTVGPVALIGIMAPASTPIYGLFEVQYRGVGKPVFDMSGVLPQSAAMAPFPLDYSHWQISGGVGVRLPWRR